MNALAILPRADDLEAVRGYDPATAREMLVSLGISAMEDIDRNRWLMGDIVNVVETTYGADDIATYAGEIGVKRQTLYSYGRVAKAFPEYSPHGKTFNRDNLPENITWSHCRETCALDPLDAWRLLEDASEQGYTVDQLARSIRPTTDKPKPFTCEAVLDEIIYEHIVLFVGCPLDGLQVGKRYRVKMEEIIDDQNP
jgi:hypothetical protein